MENTRATPKSHHEAINAIDRHGKAAMKPLDAVEEFSRQIARAVDVSIMGFLNRVVGPNWKTDNLEIEQAWPSGFQNEPRSCYYIRYAGRRIGRIRYLTASDGKKIIGNVCVELLEEDRKCQISGN